MKIRSCSFLGLLAFIALVAGCTASGNKGQVATSVNLLGEPAWIVEGHPVEFEGEQWFPQDGVDTFLDSEIRQVTTHKNIPVYVDKVDIRPYDRLYTKFDKYRYRYFEKISK